MKRNATPVRVIYPKASLQRSYRSNAWRRRFFILLLTSCNYRTLLTSLSYTVVVERVLQRVKLERSNSKHFPRGCKAQSDTLGDNVTLVRSTPTVQWPRDNMFECHWTIFSRHRVSAVVTIIRIRTVYKLIPANRWTQWIC